MNSSRARHFHAAAPKPTSAYATSGCTANSISTQPATLIALVISITRPLGIESANAPTSGASNTYETTKLCFSASKSPPWVTRWSLSMLVTIAIIGCRCRNEASLSSASATR